MGSKGVRTGRLIIASVALVVFVLGWLGARRDLRVGELHRASTRRTSTSGAYDTAIARAIPDAPSSISGIVLTSKRSPISGARVCATCASCEAASTPLSDCVQADVEGRFELTGLTPIGYQLAAFAPGFAATPALDGRPIVARVGQNVSGIEILLKDEGVEVAGTVLDATGGPVPQAAVRVISSQAPRVAITVSSGETGAFSTRVRSGAVIVTAAADGYAQARAHAVAPSRNIELVLTPGSTVRGRVVGAEYEQPIGGAEVRAQLAGTSPVPNQWTSVSTEQGAFEIAGLEPGSYLLTAASAHGRGNAAQPIFVGLGDTIEDVVIRLSPAVRVSGTVIVGSTKEPCQRGVVVLGPPMPGVARPKSTVPNAAGSPLPRSALSLFANVGADGSVLFEGVPQGHYFATVNCHEHVAVQGPDSISVGTEDVVDLKWVVEPGLGLSIRVVDASGKPVAGAAALLLFPAEEGSPSLAMPLLADQDGRIKVARGLSPGRYSIKSKDHKDSQVAVDLRAGSGMTDVVLTLPGSATIFARVVTRDGKPVDAVAVHATRVSAGGEAEAKESLSATPLGDGRYRLGALDPGPYRVAVNDGTNPPVYAGSESTALVNARANLETEVSVVLERGQSISGRILDSDKGPMPNVWVTAVAESMADKRPLIFAGSRMTPRRVLTGLNGEFRIDRLMSGEKYSLRAEGPGETAASRSAVGAGEMVELVLSAPAAVASSSTGGPRPP